MTDQPAERATPPPPVMMQLLFGKQLTYSLSGVARLGVADHMDGDGDSRSRTSPPEAGRTRPRSTASCACWRASACSRRDRRANSR